MGTVVWLWLSLWSWRLVALASAPLYTFQNIH